MRVLPVVYFALKPRSDLVLSLLILIYISLPDDLTSPGVELPQARNSGVVNSRSYTCTMTSVGNDLKSFDLKS